MSLEVSTWSQTTLSEDSFVIVVVAAVVVVVVAIDVVVVVAVVVKISTHICVQCYNQYRISIIGQCKGRPC